MKSIGFIGLGTMGLPMARHLLQKGYSLTVYNRTISKATELQRFGASVALSPADAGKHADVIITMLSNDDALQDVFFGGSGLHEVLQPGQTVIDCSTVSPELSRRLYNELAEYGVDFLDAPVTGSKTAAESASLVFMVGGETSVLEAHQDLFAAMGRMVRHMGPSGSGSYTKLALNTMVGIHAVALCEGLSMASSAGLDPEAFLSVVKEGAGNSRLAELKGPKIIERDFNVQFSLDLMLKDLKLASDLAQQQKLSLPALDTAKNLFQMAQGKGYGEEDLAAVVKLYEEWMGNQVRKMSARSKSAAANKASGAASASDRRKGIRVPMNVKVMISVYQWEQEGAFKGQQIEGRLADLSNQGLQIVSKFPLSKDMFVIFHFPQEADLPPITSKIIRVEPSSGEYRYGCMMSGVPPYVRIKLEDYIRRKAGA